MSSLVSFLVAFVCTSVVCGEKLTTEVPEQKTEILENENKLNSNMGLEDLQKAVATLRDTIQELTKDIRRTAETAATKTKVDQLTGELRANTESIEELKKADEQHKLRYAYSIYTRWGRTTCPNGAELMYDGYAGGSHYNHNGAAANPLCLPKNPDFGPSISIQGNAFVYGAEYEHLPSSFFQSRQLQDHDVPCAVCRIPRASVVMVPGKNRCQSGWHLEYHGYLMTGHHQHDAASQYSCMDSVPETVSDGEHNKDGYLFYTAEVQCGSLKCPPYGLGLSLTCGVCSK